jgi:hypothetical protein
MKLKRGTSSHGYTDLTPKGLSIVCFQNVRMLKNLHLHANNENTHTNVHNSFRFLENKMLTIIHGELSRENGSI